MLFDLRGRGRRRTIQGIYLGLAVLMGGGLIFFGVGGSGVGLFNNDNSGGGNTDSLKSATKLADAAQKRAVANPRNSDAWSQVVLKRYTQATQGKNYDANTQEFTDNGRVVLQQVSSAWARYLALKPAKVDLQAARRMLVAFSPALADLPQALQSPAQQGQIPLQTQAGLNDPAKAADAEQIVLDQQPSLSGYAELVVLSYLAKPPRTRLGDLAETKAIALAGAKQRTAVKKQLDQIKQVVLGASLGTGTSTTPSLPGGG